MFRVGLVLRAGRIRRLPDLSLANIRGFAGSYQIANGSLWSRPPAVFGTEGRTTEGEAAPKLGVTNGEFKGESSMAHRGLPRRSVLPVYVGIGIAFFGSSVTPATRVWHNGRG